MVRCAINASDQPSKDHSARFKELLCPLKFLQEVWQDPRYCKLIASDSPSETYYDCLQCPGGCERGCRLVTMKHLQNERIKLMQRNNDDSCFLSTSRSKTRLLSDHINYKRKKLSNDDEQQFNVNESSYCLISDSESKDSLTPETMMTPAKMRSSLARPVRVHDSCKPNNKASYAFYNPRINLLASTSNNLVDAPSTAFEDTNTNTTTTTHHREFASSIHMRLEDMLEMARGKRISRSLPRHAGFKDTQRLLDAAIALNQVDQGNRYNVKRCSLMWGGNYYWVCALQKILVYKSYIYSWLLMNFNNCIFHFY